LRGRTAVRVALLALAAAASAVALGPPRLTWENRGLRVQHPAHQAACALVGAAALAAATVPFRPRPLAAAGCLAAGALAMLAAQRLAWKVEVVDSGVHERALTGWTRIAWHEVEAVDSREDSLLLRGRKGPAITLHTRRFGGEDRSRLERAVARRIKEASGASRLR